MPAQFLLAHGACVASLALSERLEHGMPEPGLIQRLRDKVSARRAASAERAHRRKAVAARREAERAARKEHSGPPNIGGGVG